MGGEEGFERALEMYLSARYLKRYFKERHTVVFRFLQAPHISDKPTTTPTAAADRLT